ncbi:trichohyalin-like isoform X2 [Pempheris klunzingeri]|uniref:trichohyalin-like isoform X2 n=1 Tax=Pempheris klunzingeri TaxID=3127111 RepID=UPI0039816535
MSLSDQQWSPTSVQVTVLQARGLRIKGKSGTNDAYAVMQVGKEKYQTSVVEKCVAPVWKEEAAFDLPPLLLQGGGTERSTLRVHVLHRALVGPDKLLGQAVISLLQLSEDRTRNKTEWFKLLDKTGKADKDRGEVLVDIQFMRNNMTASMFDLSAAGKSRSRLGKFKDKVRGKKKESDASSTMLPSFTQVLTDSEEEEKEGNEGGEVAASKDEKKKKHKMKSLFSSKSNLQRNMSQSMSVLPAKNSSLSSSQSSGLNVDSSEGKKKFKFMIHKRSDSKDSSSGQQKHGPAEQSNLCINGSHVYCEEPQPRASRISSNFSLTSSGHGSMEDVPESSPPSVDSLRAVTQYSPWKEEEEEMEEETAEAENITEDEQTLEEEGRIRMVEERKRKAEEEDRVRRQEEERERMAEEKRKREEEERRRTEEERAKREEEEKIRTEEREKKRQEEERERIAEEKRRIEEEEKRQREEEERIRMEEERAQEERRRREAEERARKQEEERKLEEKKRLEEEEEKRAEEERRRREEEEMVRREEEQEEKRRQEEKERRIEEEERIRMEEERAREERRRREVEERARKQEEERKLEEKKRLEEEEERIRREEKTAEEERRRREEEEMVRRQEEEQEEKRRQEEKERRRIEEEERIRMEEERAQEERRREVEERARKQEEERNLEKKRVRKEEEERVRREEERAEEERRRREEEEMVRRQEEEREEKRRLEEQERKRMEQEERIKKEEEEKARKEKEEYERLVEKNRKLEEEERKRIEEEERLRVEEERRQREEEEEERVRRQEQAEKLAEEKGILEEQERRRIEEEEKRQREEEEKMREEEERRKKEAEREKLAEEKRILGEQERRRIEEEEERQREEEERTEEEERARKEKEEMERLAEERTRLEEQEIRSVEEEERIGREEKADKERKEEEARKLEKETLRDAEEKKKKKENETKHKAAGTKPEAAPESPAEVTSTNPFDEDVSNNPSEENHDSSTGLSTIQQRCQPAASTVGSETVSTKENELISTQRDRRAAPQPPGRNQAQRQSQREQDVSTRHQAQMNKHSKDKEVKTVSVLPQRSVKMISPLNKSPADAKNTQSLMQSGTTKGTSNVAKHSKRPAPARPRSVEEEPSSDPKTASQAKQVPVVYGLNPFEDDEDENEPTARDDPASGNTRSVQWPPARSQAADKGIALQTKSKSSKTARAPLLPAKKAATSSTLISQNTGDRVTDNKGVTAPVDGVTRTRDPEPEARRPVHIGETRPQESQPATVQSPGEEAGGKKEGPPRTSRRLQPVKPLSPLEQQSVSLVKGGKDDKTTGIFCEVQEKTKVNDTRRRGPYSQLTQEELISLVLKQENQLSQRDKKISEMELYIDNLLVRVMEEKPSILMSMNSLKKAV